MRRTARQVAVGLVFAAAWAGCAQNVEPGGTGGGGSSPTGGQATGGLPNTGGAPIAGGVTTSGGVAAGGGSGAVTATGGASGVGGSSGGGAGGGNAGSTSPGGAGTGAAGSGGVVAIGGGGSGGHGGAATGGVATGGVSTGGVTSTPCTLQGSPNPGSASFTYYYFAQGTYKDTGSGKYQTACGYLGTGNGMTDTVDNIAGPNYFVAIPGQNSSNFENSKYCGGCVQLTNGGTSVIATVIDECPQSSNPLCTNGHLDVSKSAFDKLGYKVGNPSGTTWKFVPCPIKGNIVVRVKPGNMNEIYIENLIVALQSVSMDGQQANRQSYGAWHFSGNISAGATLMLTDIAGRMVSVKVESTTQGQNQDTGVQFPTCQ
jgi:expansin (peptidoglycan-binding protein)